MPKTDQPQTTHNPKERDAASQIIVGAQTFTAETLDGVRYFSTTYRATAYMTYVVEAMGVWCVTSRRLALGPRNFGGAKYHGDLAQLAANCRAFAALPGLIESGAL